MSIVACSVEGCEGNHFARSFCKKHYMRFKRHGDVSVVKTGGVPAKPKPPRRKRYFWEKVDKSGACWIWLGTRFSDGYGVHAGKLAHRVSYKELRGDIPEGLELDHLCRNPPCVNPEHLEPVTREENMRRRTALKTHCKQGHEFTPKNSYIRSNGGRSCRACGAASAKRYMDRKKMEAA